MARIIRAVRLLLFGNAKQRRRVRQECAQIAASFFGDFQINEDYKLWREDIEFLATYNRLSPNNPYSQDRKYTLRELCRFTKHLPGGMAECGSYEGASAYFLANEAPETPLFLFDSFEGLSVPTSLDRKSPDADQYWRKGDLSASEEKVRETLHIFSNVFIYKGWIPERFEEVQDRQFRFIHIDVDLYQPTYDSIAFFYPRLVKGGMMVLDDYGFTNCPGAFRAVQDYQKIEPVQIIHLPTGQGIIIKP